MFKIIGIRDTLNISRNSSRQLSQIIITKSASKDMILTILTIQEFTFIDLYNTLNNASDNLVLEVSIGGGYNSNLDWASDYLWALFIGENIAEFCESIVAKEQSGLIEFVFIPKKLTELTSKLIWLATPFEEDSKEDIEFQGIQCSSIYFLQ